VDYLNIMERLNTIIKHLSRQPVPRPRFKPGFSRIQVRRFNKLGTSVPGVTCGHRIQVVATVQNPWTGNAKCTDGISCYTTLLELRSIRKESVVAYLWVLSQHSLEETEENAEKLNIYCNLAEIRSRFFLTTRLQCCRYMSYATRLRND